MQPLLANTGRNSFPTFVHTFPGRAPGLHADQGPRTLGQLEGKSPLSVPGKDSPHGRAASPQDHIFSVPAFNESEIQSQAWEDDFLRLCLHLEWRVAFVFSPSEVSWTSKESPEEAGGFPTHRNRDVARMSVFAV